MTEITDRSGVLPELEVILGRIAELEMRLRERIDECAELTEQVRCLEAERKIRDEYLGSIEVVAVRLDEVDRERIAIEAARVTLQQQFNAYRAAAGATIGELQAQLAGDRARLAELTSQVDEYHGRISSRFIDGFVNTRRRLSIAPRRVASWLTHR